MVINKDWKIEADSYNIILLQRKVSEPSEKFPLGNENWDRTNHPTVQAAFKWLIKKEVAITELKDLKAIGDCLDRLFKLIGLIKVVTIEKIISKKEEREVEEE